MASNLTSITEDQFDQLYQYIMKLSGSNLSSIEFGGHRLKITDTDSITFSREAYTLAFVHREKGIIALPQKHTDNERIRTGIHLLITKLINEAESHH